MDRRDVVSSMALGSVEVEAKLSPPALGRPRPPMLVQMGMIFCPAHRPFESPHLDRLAFASVWITCTDVCNHDPSFSAFLF